MELISKEGMQKYILKIKYLGNNEILEWIKNMTKFYKVVSVYWKTILTAFLIVVDLIVCRLGDR